MEQAIVRSGINGLQLSNQPDSIILNALEQKDILEISAFEVCGKKLIDLNENETATVLAYIEEKLESVFGPPRDERARLVSQKRIQALYKRMIDNSWTSKRVQEAMKYFEDTHTFPDWKPGNILNYDVRVLTEAGMLAKCKKDNLTPSCFKKVEGEDGKPYFWPIGLGKCPLPPYREPDRFVYFKKDGKFFKFNETKYGKCPYESFPSIELLIKQDEIFRECGISFESNKLSEIGKDPAEKEKIKSLIKNLINAISNNFTAKK